MATKTTKTKTRASTEYEIAHTYWSDYYGIGWGDSRGRTKDRLDSLETRDLQMFWRWLKNLDYTDGSAGKINTPGANSRSEIIAQIRAFYPDLRETEMRGYGKKAVKVEDPYEADAPAVAAVLAREAAPADISDFFAGGGGGARAEAAAGDDDDDDEDDQDNTSDDDEEDE